MKPMKQKESTIRFWDHYYASKSSGSDPDPNANQRNNDHNKGSNSSINNNDANDSCVANEWILNITDGLLTQLASFLPVSSSFGSVSSSIRIREVRSVSSKDRSMGVCGNETIHILEIGCGDSILSRSLFLHLLELQQRSNSDDRQRFHVLATDVSGICIESNTLRDAGIRMDNHEGNSLTYRVFDALSDPPLTFASSNDNQSSGHVSLMLDKGCLDTFLHRSSTRTKSNPSVYSPLLLQLLNTVHANLDDNGTYVVLTPRKRIRELRDYGGFRKYSVTRLLSAGGGGDGGKSDELGLLEGGRTGDVYLHRCTKDGSYAATDNIQNSFTTVGENNTAAGDLQACDKCRTTFEEYMKVTGGGKGQSSGTDSYWKRRWKGHLVHCKG
mmetsp:Transcript_40890/g.41581  ORF Transcript_40890/g.41581 Transcript_40890/m.41581 type:complete len:385 (-) Transcript_40890:107-1261(-)